MSRSNPLGNSPLERKVAISRIFSVEGRLSVEQLVAPILFNGLAPVGAQPGIDQNAAPGQHAAKFDAFL